MLAAGDSYAVRGIAVCTDDGWMFATDGLNFTRTGGARSCDVIPYRPGTYKLDPIGASA
jgi:hypothetical protein